MNRRARFDDVILEHVNAGKESYQDLSGTEVARLVGLYFEEYGEWGDALYDNMSFVFDPLKRHDISTFGWNVYAKLVHYVRPYIQRQLQYQALCRRELEETADER